ncbi:MAG: phosphosulfolactate synthase [Candidatus Dormiibacterota bacterium]
MTTIAHPLTLPGRYEKPRQAGLTMVIDGGLANAQFEDLLESHGHLIDLLKLGWGTALVTRGLDRKIAALREAGVDFYFGGTLFEIFLQQGKLDDYRRFCQHYGCKFVEVSNGTIDLSNGRKAECVARLSEDFEVISEVGYKDEARSQALPPVRWISYIREDLEAGARHVITEARESGRSGICRADGELRFGLIEEILESGLDIDRLVFEAPNKTLQTYFVKRIGSNVNLGNVAPADIVPLETLRLGLRSDTVGVVG